MILWYLGNCYFFGEGVQKDESEAVRWLRLAADQGDKVAHFYLGKRDFSVMIFS